MRSASRRLASARSDLPASPGSPQPWPSASRPAAPGPRRPLSWPGAPLLQGDLAEAGFLAGGAGQVDQLMGGPAAQVGQGDDSDHALFHANEEEARRRPCPRLIGSRNSVPRRGDRKDPGSPGAAQIRRRRGRTGTSRPRDPAGCTGGRSGPGPGRNRSDGRSARCCSPSPGRGWRKATALLLRVGVGREQFNRAPFQVAAAGGALGSS